ncbi:HypC/HybG/HupF family hydrogenase formation chaperone [Clostridium cylindrosporum]|uniref:Hydrogenase maturation protein HypC n=1 Tax=Clostridium cylindrosporum DSM 605 TaxID=1121307 RepID=A0A0J8G3F5_CLOCY|nr:HypC/HybG/HupF family hydrogenase formation chaperone [Clostridium cylindrosporum]KMT22236.1 hydrogenase maturation protein HypC [Clostridium cylindrosporum DSM 605]
MCVAVPGMVVKVYQRESIVDFEGVEMTVNTSLIENLQIGDYVLVHVGCAIEKISEEGARENLELLKEIASLSED